jgi:hypothetical protein
MLVRQLGCFKSLLANDSILLDTTQPKIWKDATLVPPTREMVRFFNLDQCMCVLGVYNPLCNTQSCPSGQIRSFDGVSCLTCPSGVTNITLSDTRQTSVCTCPVLSIFDPATNACAACARGYYPSSDLSVCLSCPDPTNMVASIVSNNPPVYSCSCRPGFATRPVHFCNTGWFSLH